MYQLVIFDWDGTIMDSAMKIASCIQVSAKDVGLSVPTIAEAKNIIGLGLHEAMCKLFPDATSAELKAMVDAYKYHFVTGDKTEQKLFDGVAKGLHALEEAGAILAVATGKSRVGLDRVLNAVDLKHHFVVTRCADETRSKPHPQMLHEILDFTAIDPHKAIMIGDTTYDLDMAVNANISGLGAGYGVHSNEMLVNSKALSVEPSFEHIITWLLDNRIERAYQP
jgi:phosphoglycolate phosphatase